MTRPKMIKVKDMMIRVCVNVRLNATQIVLIDRMIDAGIYGMSRQDIVSRLVDAQLQQICANSIPHAAFRKLETV